MILNLRHCWRKVGTRFLAVQLMLAIPILLLSSENSYSEKMTAGQEVPLVIALLGIGAMYFPLSAMSFLKILDRNYLVVSLDGVVAWRPFFRTKYFQLARGTTLTVTKDSVKASRPATQPGAERGNTLITEFPLPKTIDLQEVAQVANFN